jgi:hypothetical protein
MTMISCGRTQNIDELKKKYIFDDFQVYIEKPLTTDNNADRYTIDNKAYKLNRKFIFDYHIIKGKDTFKVTAPKMTAPDSDFQREWSFTSNGNKHEDQIETISITVLPGISNENQTMLK